MSKNEYQTPLNYIYLDGAGIDSLHAQTTARLETQYVSERENHSEGKLGWGAALKLLIFADAKADAELSLSGRNLEKVTSLLSGEQKLTGLIRYLKRFENKNYFEEIYSAICQIDQGTVSCFLNIQTIFDLPQFYSGGVGLHTINHENSVSFEIIPSPSTNNSRIIMSASLEKFTRVRDDVTLGPTSHEAIIFSGFKGRNVPLGVFGSLSTLGSALYLKPYAIWI